MFIFDGGQILDQVTPAATAADEIATTRFWNVQDLDQALPTRLHVRVASALETNGDAYLELGALTDLRSAAP